LPLHLIVKVIIATRSMAEEAVEKRMIGNLWADASEGRCVFAMPTDNDFSSLDAVLN
jgi:type III restriction enzyme